VPTGAVVIPIKAFGAAKARLGSALDGAERVALAREMAATVIAAAAATLPVLVVTDDDEVGAFALEHGADVVLYQAEPGLNAAVTEAVEHLEADGIRWAVIVHADLPRATSLAGLHAGETTIVPDRHETGTNVLVVPTDVGFTFAYGPGSFAAHLAEAERLGLSVRIVRDPDLAWDIDTPDDLSGRTGSQRRASPAG
jgi:2-phospho-L-lactate guanylyltransferase